MAPSTLGTGQGDEEGLGGVEQLLSPQTLFLTVQMTVSNIIAESDMKRTQPSTEAQCGGSRGQATATRLMPALCKSPSFSPWLFLSIFSLLSGPHFSSFQESQLDPLCRMPSSLRCRENWDCQKSQTYQQATLGAGPMLSL